jgi:hypothetical protein
VNDVLNANLVNDVLNVVNYSIAFAKLIPGSILLMERFVKDAVTVVPLHEP